MFPPSCFQRLRPSINLCTNLARSRSIKQHALTFSRRQSSSVPFTRSSRSWSPIIIGSIASGLIGYCLSAFGKPYLISEALEETEHKYGTPKDFEQAIRELRALFDSDDAVSTHPEDLRIHGYSENDYHPSGCFHSVELRISPLMLVFQVHLILLSYTQRAQKMWSKLSRLQSSTVCPSPLSLVVPA
jgi:D-lactate dehydrogenase (cytochrome)